MRTALSAAAAAAAAAAGLTVLLRDPQEPFAMLTVVVAVGVAVGAIAARLLLPVKRTRGSGERTVRALRRGLAIGATVGLLAALRALDGLTPLTAAFVVAGFALAEVALTARAS